MFALIRNHDVPTKVQNETFEYGSDWVVVAKHQEDFGPLAADTRWRKPAESPRDKIWTDDYSNLLSVIKW